jgi:MFS family permease
MGTPSQPDPEIPRTHMGAVQWLVCFVAAMGFLFDIYEILVAPLVLPPALRSFGFSNPADINYWKGLLFWVPAMAGGIFGLLGGYLTDLWGRQRVLVWSILIYTVSAFASGFASSVQELLILRCFTFAGVCVEFVAAVAWLAELFPNPKQREAVLGTTQAFSSLGGILAAGAYYLSVTYGNSFPQVHGGHEAWRYTIMSGLLPAIPLLIVRPFLPESPVWKQKKLAGTLHRPSVAEIFAPQFRKTTIVTSLMFACSYGAAFGAIQQLPDIVPGLPGVSNLPRQAQQQTVSGVQTFQEIGGLTGRVLLAILAVYIVRRRTLLRIFQVPGLLIVPLVFIYPAIHDLGMLKAGIFLAGLFTVAQFSFWGNYLPRVYPTHLRGTGEGFAANVGGRMIGTSAALLATTLANVMPGATPPTQMAYAATAVALLAYGGGVVLSFFLPEPQSEKLME